jgi:hypothetical protein
MLGVSACVTSIGPETDLEPREWTDAGHDAEAVIAMVEEAADAWTASCPDPDEYGLCVSFDPAQADPNQCHGPVLGQVVVHQRDQELVSRARELFERALDHADGLDDPADPARLAAYRRALGRAHMGLADADIETYFEIALPRDLDFRVEVYKAESTDPAERAEYEAQVARKEASQEAFRAYFDAKVALSKSIIGELASVQQTEDPASVVSAALRTSWVSGQFVDQLRGAAIPESMRGREEQSAAYCKALRDHTEAPLQMALDAATSCRDLAEARGVSVREARTCAELVAAFTDAVVDGSAATRSAPE